MSVLRWCDLDLFCEYSMLQSLTHNERRPNLLVYCSDTPVRSVLPSLAPWCVAPLHRRSLPGPLGLPAQRSGTLLLEDVDALTIRQQIELYDWLSADPGQPQLVSLTARPLDDLVRSGRFLEGLYYRLNVVRVEAMAGAPAAAARHQGV
jgi:transcriptional regulator of aromatic amino acid metabolism